MADPGNTNWKVPEEIAENLILSVDVKDVSAAMQRFGWPDYVIFMIMLLVCIAVGLYFAHYGSSQQAEEEYLVGGRNMKTIPVSMSLIASFVSGISLLGIPTETYVYGIQYLWICLAILFMALVAHFIFLPIFQDLKMTSTYEYLEKRFDRRIRLFGSLLFTFHMIVWLPVVIYIPALAFNQVTGVHVHLITPVVCVVCIIYTTMGGIKAVVWTDVIQIVVMYGAILLVIAKGTYDIGGPGKVFNRNWDSGRIEWPNMEVDIYARQSFWSLAIGGFFYWVQDGTVNQTMIQRYLALPNLKSARRALWIFTVGVIIVQLLGAYAGMLIYATFHRCDPLTTKLASKKDQLLPILVMEVLGDFPGMPGLFVAGIFSAALSSLSTGLNSMAAIVLEDFYKGLINKNVGEKKVYMLMRLTVVIFGIICVALVYVVENLGAVMQMVMSLSAIILGPALSLFLMGVLIPWINPRGALYGGIASLIFMTWLILNAQAAIANGLLTFPEKPVSTEGCLYSFIPKNHSPLVVRLEEMLSNGTEFDHQAEEVFFLYKVSYLWYTIIGLFVSISVALTTSFLTTPTDPRDINKNLLAPFLRRFIPSRQTSCENCSNDVQKRNSGQDSIAMGKVDEAQSA